jgi:glyoxylase-like metal-dependent hydrolase (beta-lactamase superfamily II)
MLPMTDLPEFLHPLGGGLYAIDTGFHRPHFDAAYLVVEAGRAAFIDTGTNFALPRHLAALAALGVAAEEVDYVIPTHVHLDHAGGAGALMATLPNARMIVHQRGARHMIDPSALAAGATAVYGPEQMARDYGELVPVPAERVQQSTDGGTVELAGRPLHFIDTPGHARHHHCIWDEATRGWFTGDSFGISYREFDTAAGPWTLASSTPVQFEPDAAARTIERLLAFEPQCAYLTHYSRVEGMAALAQRLQRQLKEMVRIGRAETDAGEARQARLEAGLMDLYWTDLQNHGWAGSLEQARTLLSVDLRLNAQGLAVWLDRA